ncbi:hypothetical protein HDU67_009984, partial [Dinochytrium kinnereticum]
AKVIEAGGFEFSNSTNVTVKGVYNSLEIAILQKGGKDPLRIDVRRTQIQDLGNESKSRCNDKGHDARHDIVGREVEKKAIEKLVVEWMGSCIETLDDLDGESGAQKRDSKAAGLILIGKSGCGKTMMGRYCEELITSKTDASKLLLLQIFDHLLLAKDELKNAVSKIESYLQEDQNHRLLMTKGKIYRSSSIHSTRTGISKTESAIRLPHLPKIGSRELSKLNSVRDSIQGSLISIGGPLTSHSFIPPIEAQAQGERNKRENDFIEILEYLGISKKWSGSAVVDELLKIVTKVLDYRVVFMVDNCQWSDIRSLTALKHILHSTSNILLILLCRPMQEITDSSASSDLYAILAMPNILKLILKNMDDSGTEAMIMKFLGYKPHPSLVEDIVRNSGGIPMVIEILARSLKAPGSIRFVNGLVKLADGVKLKADEKDVGSINFSILHVAQICNDVLANGAVGLKETCITVEEAVAIIEKEDTYDFLLHSNRKSDENPIQLSEIYFFRHIYIQKGIKSMILTDLRKRIHFLFFLYFDVIVRGTISVMKSFKLQTLHNPSGIESTFGSPLVEAFRHLEESGGLLESELKGAEGIYLPELHAVKIRVEYLVMMADYYWEKQVYGEALIILQKLFDAWDTLPSVQTQLNVHPEDMKRPEFAILSNRVAKARYAQLYSYIYRACSELYKAYDYVMIGFEYLDHNFPKSDRDCIKYGFSCLKHIILYNGQMRRFLRRVKHKRESITVTVDYSMENEREDTMNELLTLVPTRSISRSGNVFLKPINTNIATGYLYVDIFRSAICGIHTAASIALLVFEYAEEYASDCGIALDEFPNFSAESSPMRPEHLKAKGTDLRSSTLSKPENLKSDVDRRTTIPIVFDIIGTPPLGFSLDSAQLFFAVGYVARIRDLFEMQEKYLRLASVVLFELKSEGSFMNITSIAYYRELMFFSGSGKIAPMFLERLLNGIVDMRLFQPYARSDACHYAVEALNFKDADKWELDYYRWAGLKGFYVNPPLAANGNQSPSGDYVAKVNTSKSVAVASHTSGEIGEELTAAVDAKRLPPFLERDAHMPFVLFSLERIERGFGAELELIGKNLDQLVRGNANIGPNMRFIFLFRVITSWHIWTLYNTARLRWFRCVVFANTKPETTNLLLRIDIMRSKLSSKFCQTWSKVAIAFAVASKTYLSTVVQPMHQGTFELGRGKSKRAIGLWNNTIQLVDDMMKGKVVPLQGLVGEFTEPNEWRGMRFFGYHRDFLVQRVVVLESLDVITKILDRIERWSSKSRRKVEPISDRGGPFIPHDLQLEWTQTITRLTEVAGSLQKYGDPYKLDVMLATSVQTFLRDFEQCS